MLEFQLMCHQALHMKLFALLGVCLFLPYNS
jgi:hypothetical protein